METHTHLPSKLIQTLIYNRSITIEKNSKLYPSHHNNTIITTYLDSASSHSFFMFIFAFLLVSFTSATPRARSQVVAYANASIEYVKTTLMRYLVSLTLFRHAWRRVLCLSVYSRYFIWFLIVLCLHLYLKKISSYLPNRLFQ